MSKLDHCDGCLNRYRPWFSDECKECVSGEIKRAVVEHKYTMNWAARSRCSLSSDRDWVEHIRYKFPILKRSELTPPVKPTLKHVLMAYGLRVYRWTRTRLGRKSEQSYP